MALELKKRRRSGQRGSQVVEVGLTLIPFMAFIFLIMDISWAVFVKAALQSAVREGTRFAVTQRTLTGMGHDDSIRSVVQQNALGLLRSSSGWSKIKVRHYSPTTLAETAGNASGDLIEVSVEGYSLVPLAHLLRGPDPLMLTARSSDRSESCPGGICPAR